MRNSLKQSLESIDFQSGALFSELVLAINEIKKLNKKDVPDSEQIQNVAAVIRHHTDISIQLVISDYGPCVEVPHINRNNVLVTEYMRGDVTSSDGMNMIAKASGVVRGGVSLGTSRITGVFKEITSRIHYPLNMLMGDKFSAEEHAAIILHEVGHLYLYFEFMSRTATTNQVLAGLSKALAKADTAKEREAVLINTKKALKLTDIDEQELAKSTSSKAVELVVISSVVQKSRSELGASIYDYNSWEYLADQFATRHGAGRYIVTSLDKLYRSSWQKSFRSLPAFLAFEAIKLALLFAVPALSVLLMGMDSDQVIYDEPGDRFKRVRNQIVENLKDRNLSKDDVESLEADLKAIDAISKNVNDRRQFVSVLIDFLSSSGKQRDYKLLQRQLEDLAANELFVHAQQLNHLTRT